MMIRTMEDKILNYERKKITMGKQKIVLVIATTSQDKIEGIKTAFLNYFPADEYEITIYSGKTDSGVSEQPFGNETYQGAYNRINNMRKQYNKFFDSQGINVNYYVSCEAGIDNTNSEIGRAHV